VTRARVGVALFIALALAGGLAAALPRVANHLPPSMSAVAHVPERLWAKFVPARVPRRTRLAGLTGPERQAVEALGRRLDGKLVWSSNRSGNHELYLVDFRARTVTQLTHHPNVDFFSRFSPDGRRIVFLRSQREGVSFRDPTAWDVMLMNVDGTGEQRIVTGGYHPTWTADGTAIVFERDMRFMRYDLGTRQETVLLDGRATFPGVSEIGDVEFAPDGQRLSFGLRGTFHGAFGLQGPFSGAVVLDLTTRELAVLTREQACQPTWSRDGRLILWMETGGRGGTHIMASPSDERGRHVFMDLPGAYSHEYFPKLSNDGRWLTWGAAAEGHEHDRADYEIFVWEVGTPWESATRLTFHEGNDQWPDLWVPVRP
jgi:hypothetical protein